MNRIRRITAWTAAILLLIPALGSRAEVTAERTVSRGKVTEITWKDENGSVTAGPEGYATVRYTYAGMKTSERYFDEKGFPYETQGGYFGLDITRDGRKNISQIEYIGINGKPVENSLGYAVMKASHYSFNAEHTSAFFAANGKTPVLVPSLGYAQVENEYNGMTQVGRYYRDEKGNPVDIPAGYATVLYSLSRKQKGIVRIRYLHADESPATGPDGWSESVIERDDKGRPVKIQYKDEQGNLTDRGGCAWEEHRYGNGGLDTLTRYSAAGEKIPYEGSAVSVRRKMKGEQVLEETYLNEAGEAATLQAGYAGISYSYNGAGQLVTTQYLDANGGKTVCREGYAGIRNTWDKDSGNLISTVRLDLAGQAVNSSVTGVCEERYEYDEAGRLTAVKKYDAAGRQIQ